MNNEDLKTIKFNDTIFVNTEQAPDLNLDLQESESFLKEHPDDVLALINKGIALGRLKRYKDAEEILKEAKQLSLKNNPEGLGQFSMVAFNMASFLDEVSLDEKSEQKYLDSINLGIILKVLRGLVFATLVAYDLGIKHKNDNLPDAEEMLSLAIYIGKSSDKPEGYLLQLGKLSILLKLNL